MIEVWGLIKRYGQAVAVDDLSFEVSAGQSRSAFNHLPFLTQSNGNGGRRVREVLELVGLEQVAPRRAGKFCLGMGRLPGISDDRVRGSGHAGSPAGRSQREPDLAWLS